MSTNRLNTQKETYWTATIPENEWHFEKASLRGMSVGVHPTISKTFCA